MASSLMDHVSRERVVGFLAALEGERNPATSPERLLAAQSYVAEAWRSWGLQVSLDAVVDGEQCAGLHNVIAHPDGNPTRPRLIIGAHLDTVAGTPGADDNASGVAALLEASRVIATNRVSAAVEFVGFALEEVGMIGSSQYAERLRQVGQPLIGMLSLEMVGFTEAQGLQHYPWFLKGRFPSMGTYLGLGANRRSHRLLKTVAEAMRSVPDLPIETLVVPANGAWFPEIRLSDHAPFWDAGYPALLVTDTAFFRNPHYHQPTDTVSTLDLDFLTKVTQGLVRVIEELAGG